MRIFSLLAAVAIVACAHQSANVPEPVVAAPSEPAPAAPAETTAAVTAEVAPAAAVPPAEPAGAAVPAERRAGQNAKGPNAVGGCSQRIHGPARRAGLLSGQIAAGPANDRLTRRG